MSAIHDSIYFLQEESNAAIKKKTEEKPKGLLLERKPGIGWANTSPSACRNYACMYLPVYPESELLMNVPSASRTPE